MTKILITIVGPTAIGKTALAIALANYFNTEIISADSRQIYSEMSIGTAVPSLSELAAAKHHCIQHRSILEPYSVGDFEREALAKINTLHQSNHIAILVGGSGLYVNTVTDGLDDFPDIDPSIRIELNEKLAHKGLKYLQQELKRRDAKTYNSIDIENPHRVIRALEVCIGTGLPYSSYLQKSKTKRPFKIIGIGLEAERSLIYNRINDRVDDMMASGLLEEAKQLYRHKNLNALKTVGYKEIFAYLDGDITLEFAISEIKKNTRRFAKRQLTWFKKKPHTTWFGYKTDLSQIIKLIESQM